MGFAFFGLIAPVFAVPVYVAWLLWRNRRDDRWDETRYRLRMLGFMDRDMKEKSDEELLALMKERGIRGRRSALSYVRLNQW